MWWGRLFQKHQIEFESTKPKNCQIIQKIQETKLRFVRGKKHEKKILRPLFISQDVNILISLKKFVK